MKIFKELKKLGYMHYSDTTIEELDDLPLNSAERVSEQALVLRWFREKGFHCAIMPKITPSNSVVYYMYEGKPKKNWDNCFETYEEAELVCLNKLIEIVKNEKQ
jgi:hypothetical protein